MFGILSPAVRQQLIFYCCIAIMSGLILSRALMSIGMIAIIANAIIRPDFKSIFQSFIRSKLMLATSSVFFIYLLSGLYSDDLTLWIERVKLKVPWLLLPYAFCAAAPFSKKQYHTLLYIFILVITATCLWSLASYFSEFHAMNASYLQAKALPTPMGDHTRFSLMAAFAVLAGFFLYRENFCLKYKSERYLLAFCTLTLFVFIHVLAARSGLLAFYVSLLYLLGREIMLRKKYLAGVFALCLLIGLPILAYHTVPTLKHKIGYMRYDLGLYMSGNNTEGLSDARRIYSIEASIKTGMQNPLIGAGMGDVKEEMDKIYTADYPFLSEAGRLMPHNQFVWIFAGTGLIGLAAFLFAFSYPLILDKNYSDALFMSLHLILFTSLFSEATFEGQTGTAFYILFLFLGLNKEESS